ncbi:hypothetical protein CVD28_11115 [Bacillus sp. M6-12]|uniref:glycosyltransferase family 2 protein n=1 Tax=Bacillus sp. M6-12 TaxID=2054166 RepID=UPI000C774562|nr:glycosyltransferase [Bacillus sp. M6-12]PLS17542.1 hypothetical protein CVD28_11115 [Bacillus sp. M6-12]
MCEVSIIIPSYNRYPLNLLTLRSLEKQTFDMDKMEVILLDDASTDSTPLLKSYPAPFPYHYVRNKTNMGLSRTRNIGYKMAKGNVIIFLDAEVIVDNDYVKNQYDLHLKNPQSVIVARNIYNLYSFLFPNYDSSQLNEMSQLAKNSTYLNKRLKEMLKLSNDELNLQTAIEKITEPLQLIHEEEVLNLASLNPFCIPSRFFNDFYTELGDNLDNSHIAWWALFGLNHSLNKNLLAKVNGYDEDFQGWGMEDVDFAYRLYKIGAKFVFDHKSALYHQEHPVTPNKKQDAQRNGLLFQQKHPAFEVYVRSLKFSLNLDAQFIGLVFMEYEALNLDYPGQHEVFKESIYLLLQQRYILKTNGKKARKLLKNSGIADSPEKKDRLFSDRDTVEAYGKYPNLVKLFDLVVSK